MRMRPASPPLILLSTSYRTDIPKAEMPLQKRACFTTPAFRFEVRESSAAGAARQPGLDVAVTDATAGRPMYRKVGYGITDTWDEIVEAIQEIASTTLEGVNQRVTKLDTTVRHDSDEFYMPYHRRIAMILDREATYARRACTGSKDKSAAIEAHVRSLEKMEPKRRTATTTTTSTPMTDVQIKALIERDRPYHRRIAMILDREATYARRACTGSKDKSAAIEAHVRSLEVHVATLMAHTSSLQNQLTTTLGCIQTLEARDPEPQNEPAKAGSSSLPSLDYVPGPEHPPSPDYVPGLEHPHLPVYVPKPEYLEYLVLSGDEEPIEDQPLLADALPTSLSLGYVADFDPEEDLEKDHADYPADGGDGDDESSNDEDDADEKDEEASKDEDNEEEEEEH
nr:hypothetical protein [Tanacetum cinerariifolium]